MAVDAATAAGVVGRDKLDAGLRVVAMDVALAAAIGAAPINDATAPATKKGVKLSFLMPSE